MLTQSEVKYMLDYNPDEWREKLIAEFPLFNDEGLCQEKHHCEWALQQDRKRLHALLQSADHSEQALEKVAPDCRASTKDSGV